MGLGPEVHLVRKKDMYFLVSQEVRGVNIKDLIYSLNEPPDLLQKINSILGTAYTTKREAKSAYAKAILKDKNLIDSMKKMGERLYDQNFFDSYDFQFMISPSIAGKKGNLDIIDTGPFREITDFDQEKIRFMSRDSTKEIEPHPVKKIDQILEALKKLAYGN